MEIPKMKVIIYALTFLGYAWSGYGTSVFSTLRDAVLTAEKVFVDFMGKVGDVVEKIKYVHDAIDTAVEEECVWTCPNGAKPVKNMYHKPTSNGCGPAGYGVDETLSYPEMTKCCDAHDICYSTCMSDKDKCDIDFRKCLYRVCDPYNDDVLASKSCKVAAKMLFTATSAMGCKYWRDAQEEACYCTPSKKSKKRYPADEL